MLTRQHYHWNCFWHAEYDCLKMRLVVSKTAHTNYHIINRSLVQVLFHSAKSFRYANFNEFSLRIFACECTYYKALRIVIELKNRDQLWKLSIEATASFDSGQTCWSLFFESLTFEIQKISINWIRFRIQTFPHRHHCHCHL